MYRAAARVAVATASPGPSSRVAGRHVAVLG